jgi:hypothetical protein
MTKPNGKPCNRCKINPKIPGRGQLCIDCHGKCRLCGAPAALMPSGYFRPFCSPCRKGAEQQEFCSKCGLVRDGSHGSYCNKCYREYSREWGIKNPEKVKQKTRRHMVKREYGLTITEWNELLVAQQGRCATCRTAEPGGRGQFHTDHNHETGKIRGLLCANCNVALGMACEDPVRLRALAAYVEHHAALHASTAA